MQLTQFQMPRKNFSIFNFTTVRLREHERDSFLISNNGKMASFKEMQLLMYCLNFSNGFLLDSGIPLFTSKESSWHRRIRAAILCNTAANAKSDASVSTSKGTPSWTELRLALHRSFFNVLNAITASLLRGNALQCKRGHAFLEKLGIYFGVIWKQTRHSFQLLCTSRLRQV